MSTEETTPFDRPALAALLERYGSSLEAFLALRSDSYEHALAAHSLDQLDLFYSGLLAPGRSIEQIRETSPRWPPGTAREGRPPSTAAISYAGERLRTDAALNSLGRVSRFMDQIRSRASALPVGQQTDVLDTIVTLVGEEILQAKSGGQFVSANLEPLDRLLSREALREKSRDRELKESKFRRETCELFLKWHENQTARNIAQSNAGNAEKIERLGKLMFAENW